MQFSCDILLENRDNSSMGLPQMADPSEPFSRQLYRVPWAPATCHLLCRKTAGPRSALGSRTGCWHYAYQWWPCCGRAVGAELHLLLCIWALRISHDPVVLPTVCDLPFCFPFFFFLMFYFCFSATVQAYSVFK